jgi:hypothetical protein
VDGRRAAAMEVGGSPPGLQRGRGVRVCLEQRRRHGGSACTSDGFGSGSGRAHPLLLGRYGL